jgi:transposase
MMGTKVRSFEPLPHDLSLEDLVPQDHFYRRLEATLDLSFVRELVAPLYAGGGRPSVDPVVFFKLQLVISSRTSAQRGSSCGRSRTASR